MEIEIQSHIPHRIKKKNEKRYNLYKNEEKAKENILTWTRIMGHNPILYDVHIL